MPEMKYPHDHENDTIYFGKVNFRNKLQTFGIKTDDRRRHMYIIGKTGMGKTVLLENLFLSDVYAGHGCCYIDPHGDTAEKLTDYIPSWRMKDVVYFNPADLEFPMGFNILESIDPRMKHLVAAGLMSVFKKIWEGVWSARMEYIMNNCILALMDTPGSTLLGINRMLSDEDYRTMVIKNVQDPIVKNFWLSEFANYDAKFAAEAVAPIQNKVGQFTSAAIMRNVVAQSKSSINVREMMDSEKIFIVNLSKGYLGEDASRLLGGMLITKIQMSAMERVNIPEKDRRDFYLYVDEFQNFAVESFASILSEARKYRLNLIMAHQYIEQLVEEVRDAVFGNVGTIVSFRVGSPDATFMEQEFMPRFTPEDIINLPKYNIYLKLMIDGVTSPPFSAATLPPIGHKTGTMQQVIEHSREHYSMKREDIEKEVFSWAGFDENVDVDEALASVKQGKKDQKKKKFAHSYDCTRCKKTFELPVELDRSRPIYCEDCHAIMRAEKGGDGGAAAPAVAPVAGPPLNSRPPAKQVGWKSGDPVPAAVPAPKPVVAVKSAIPVAAVTTAATPAVVKPAVPKPVAPVKLIVPVPKPFVAPAPTPVAKAEPVIVVNASNNVPSIKASEPVVIQTPGNASLAQLKEPVPMQAPNTVQAPPLKPQVMMSAVEAPAVGEINVPIPTIPPAPIAAPINVPPVAVAPSGDAPKKRKRKRRRRKGAAPINP